MGQLFNPHSHVNAQACAICDEGPAVLFHEEQSFEYGEGINAVTLHALVPIWKCPSCEEEYMDWRAEEARHDAVCDHLNRLRPSAIFAIREQYGLTQEQFAIATGIGIASIKRWELGNLIQGEALDNYLRILHSVPVFDELQRQRERIAQPRAKRRFRTTITDAMRQESARFRLRTVVGNNAVAA